MNKIILFVIPLSFFLTSCAEQNRIRIGGCESPPPVKVCTGSFADPKVTVNINKPLNASPPNVCAQQGTTIVFTIVPATAEEGSVLIIPKDVADTWLTGRNSPDANKIEIPVPTDLKPDTPHDYIVTTSSGKCLDPRVHVM